MAMLRIGPTHRTHRKLMGQALHPRVVLRDYVALQEKFCETSHSGEVIIYIFFEYSLTGEIIQSITYGSAFDGHVDLVELGSRSTRNVGKILAGYIVDLVPWLRHLPDWFPGAAFKREAKEIRAAANETRWLPYNMVKRQASLGTAPHSFVLSALEAEEYRQNGELDDIIISASAMSLFIGVPHRLVQEDVYEGQVIPAGTTVFVNVWGILHNEHRFPDPSTFNPDRFLNMNRSDDDSAGIDSVHDKATSTINPWDVGFGYGRRVCQGIPIAETELWITMATILACFEITPKADPETMEPLLPKASWSGKSIRQVSYAYRGPTMWLKVLAALCQPPGAVPVQHHAPII
ncbi:hypothetical protein FRB97_002954 [Tulasnella sp. 331]|nr:hypothetical protein FRB97_002954 [Tulasnella sp. 331]